MTEYADIVNLIGSVGFPIVACSALFWMINTTMKELTDAITDLKNVIINIQTHEKEASE